jgi:hypothetical protein
MSVATFCATLNSFDGAAEAQLNGTSPWTVVSPGWAPQPAGRGTMDIIWSCLVTIFACSWTVTHPDFQGSGSDWVISSKVWSCVVAVIAPEVLASVAFFDYMSVRHQFKIINKMNLGQFTMSQLFLVYMGGVNLEFEDCTEILDVTPTVISMGIKHWAFSKAHCNSICLIRVLYRQRMSRKELRQSTLSKHWFVCRFCGWWLKSSVELSQNFPSQHSRWLLLATLFALLSPTPAGGTNRKMPKSPLR